MKVHEVNGVHTIAVPIGWSVECAWEAIVRGDHLPYGRVWWGNVIVRDGRFVKAYW